MMKRNILILLVLIVVAIAAWEYYVRLSREESQPASITETPRAAFLYGSEGAEKDAGIPYWIWLTLPRIFPEYMGEGGYLSMGVSWEETREMPVGMSKKTVGYVRVAGNCALCHAYSRSNGPDAAPTVYAAGPGHTAEYQKLLAFFKQCAQDPRFNADNILDEIGMATKLSTVDSIIYRYILIPRTKARFLSGDAVLLDNRLLDHARSPGSNSLFRTRMQGLQSSLSGDERAALTSWLATAR